MIGWGTNNYFETMNETTAYRNHIKNNEIETREVFERETLSPKNIQRTLPTDIVTRLDDNQLFFHEETHELEVNLEPEPSSSDSSETFSSDSRAKKNKSTKKKKVS